MISKQMLPFNRLTRSSFWLLGSYVPAKTHLLKIVSTSPIIWINFLTYSLLLKTLGWLFIIFFMLKYFKTCNYRPRFIAPFVTFFYYMPKNAVLRIQIMQSFVLTHILYFTAATPLKHTFHIRSPAPLPGNKFTMASI